MTPRFPARLLIADDHAMVRRGLRLVLDAEPDLRVVAEADDGAEAVELAREGDVDLAVLDVMMPKLTGYDVTRALRADPRTQDVPVILLTARVQEADVKSGFDAGADDYVRKPFSPQELKARVQAVLGRR